MYFVVLFNTFHKNLLFSYDLKTLEVKKKVVIPAYLVGIHYSPALDRVFVCTAISKFNKSEIFELDPGTLEVRGKMKTPIGSRDISSDNNGFLYLSNYLNGNIYMIDWKEKKIIETINVGRKIKRMIFQPEKDIITFTSEHGYGFIDPEKMGLR